MDPHPPDLYTGAQATADAEQRFAGLLGQWRRRRAGLVGTPARYHFACPVYGCSVDQQGWRGVPCLFTGEVVMAQPNSPAAKAEQPVLVSCALMLRFTPRMDRSKPAPPINKWGSRRSLITAPIKKK